MYNPTFIGDIDLNEDTLAHFGVKGMKWGRRKRRIQAKQKTRIPKRASMKKASDKTMEYSDKRWLGKAELNRKINRQVHDVGEAEYRKEYEARAGKDPTYDYRRHYNNPYFVTGTSLSGSGEKSDLQKLRDENTERIKESLKRKKK